MTLHRAKSWPSDKFGVWDCKSPEINYTKVSLAIAAFPFFYIFSLYRGDPLPVLSAILQIEKATPWDPAHDLAPPLATNDLYRESH